MNRKFIKTVFIYLLLSVSLFAKPYIILISFDGFRWDYLDRGLTPNLQKLIDDGVRAISLKPTYPSKTFPNHYSIVTGMYNENHGIISNSFTNLKTGERFRIGDTSAVRNPEWYKGKAIWETAKRQGVITASYFWPGSELNAEKRRPNYFMKYEHEKPYKERVDGVIDWLNLPNENRPKFITLYFHDTDSYGHDFGTTSKEIDESISRLDSVTGYLLSKLECLSIADSINLIIVSDHGMTDVSSERTIVLDSLVGGYDYYLQGDRAFGMIEPKDSNDIEEIYNKFKSGESNYKVYRKYEFPIYYHYNKNELITSIIIVADLGWSLIKKGNSNNNGYSISGGNHGYDNNFMDMHGIFIANGPEFKKNMKTGTLQNIDINPLLCKILNIEHEPDIDGKLENIEFILK